MIRPVLVFAFAALALGAAGCGASDDEPTPPLTTVVMPTPAPATPTTAPATPTTAPATPTTAPSTAALRRKACEDIKPFLDELRSADPALMRATVTTALASTSSDPQWATLTPDEQKATTDGINDAADGQCR